MRQAPGSGAAIPTGRHRAALADVQDDERVARLNWIGSWMCRPRVRTRTGSGRSARCWVRRCARGMSGHATVRIRRPCRIDRRSGSRPPASGATASDRGLGSVGKADGGLAAARGRSAQRLGAGSPSAPLRSGSPSLALTSCGLDCAGPRLGQGAAETAAQSAAPARIEPARTVRLVMVAGTAGTKIPFLTSCGSAGRSVEAAQSDPVSMRGLPQEPERQGLQDAGSAPMSLPKEPSNP